MVRVGPTPPSPGTLGRSRFQHAGSSAQAAASSTFRHRTVITDKDDPPRGTDVSRGYQTTAARGESRLRRGGHDRVREPHRTSRRAGEERWPVKPDPGERTQA